MKHNKKKIFIIFLCFSLILVSSYFIINRIKLNNVKNSKTEQFNSKDEFKKEVENKAKDDSETKKYLENEQKNNLDENKESGQSISDKSKEDINKENNNEFSAQKALEIVENKYGKDDDIIYDISESPQDLNGKEGYIVQVKSKSMIEQGGTGVLFSLLVDKKGEITEIS